MMIDDQTRLLLTGKLRFTPILVNRLEENKELLSQTLGLIELFKRSTNRLDTRRFVQENFKKIRRELEKPPNQKNQLLMQARMNYYTFL